MTADPVGPQETLRNEIVCALASRDGHRGEMSYADMADAVVPIMEEETARQLSALRDKVKALADELLNPRHVDGAYEWAEKPDRDHARGHVHAQRQIGEKLLALVEEPQGRER